MDFKKGLPGTGLYAGTGELMGALGADRPEAPWTRSCE